MKPILPARRAALALALPLLVCAVPRAAEAPRPSADVLVTPAAPSALAPRALINGLAQAGTRLVAVGQRGHILYSDQGGAEWQQAKVPVSSDLLAAWFATPQQGWAVGHDGVVLHSADGGATWTLQLDGRRAAAALQAAYGGADADARLREEAQRNVEQGPDKPFLDVWFADERHGYVVGAFGLIFRTEDGGQHWQPWMHRTDNPRGLHLNAIRSQNGAVYIAGEQGLMLRAAQGSDRFAAVPMPYQGSWFGMVATPQSLLAFGLRGNAWRSTDAGASWQQVATNVQTGLTAGVALDAQHVVLVSQAGQVLSSADGGATFARVAGAKPGHAAAVQGDGKGGLVIGGARGLRQQSLQSPQ